MEASNSNGRSREEKNGGKPARRGLEPRDNPQESHKLPCSSHGILCLVFSGMRQKRDKRRQKAFIEGTGGLPKRDRHLEFDRGGVKKGRVE